MIVTFPKACPQYSFVKERSVMVNGLRVGALEYSDDKFRKNKWSVYIDDKRQVDSSGCDVFSFNKAKSLAKELVLINANKG